MFRDNKLDTKSLQILCFKEKHHGTELDYIYRCKPKEIKMKKVLFLVLAALLLTSAIAIPAYSAIITNPIVILGDDLPVPPPPPR
jgi:hypothetical protein